MFIKTEEIVYLKNSEALCKKIDEIVNSLQLLGCSVEIKDHCTKIENSSFTLSLFVSHPLPHL